ncbi:hypothetical protein [Mycolicibacter virginiensis]|uniref:hypothetical protein n=1 Tax=Mycolicibacter virginiensis TaxID=1795032 RepID=UPI001F0434E4|nr:hypothetical protein [Mycolicibacter virginiensis]ULP48352.1 hypothetical protein MJO54_04175 [Mycolicibacter virginiensis]
MNFKSALIAALVAGAAALSACGAPEKPVRVTPAAAAVTTAPVRVPTPEWVNVDGKGNYEPFGYTAAAGMRILHNGTDGREKMCSPVATWLNGTGKRNATASSTFRLGKDHRRTACGYRPAGELWERIYGGC